MSFYRRDADERDEKALEEASLRAMRRAKREAKRSLAQYQAYGNFFLASRSLFSSLILLLLVPIPLTYMFVCVCDDFFFS